MGILRRLRENKKLLTDFYVFDVETAYKKGNTLYWHLDATPGSFIFGVIYGYNYTKVFHNLEELKQELLTERFKGRKVFAHNAQYDLNTVYGNLFDLDPETVFNGRFICCTNGCCTFADSMNVFVGASVKDLGKMLGKDKLGMSNEYDYSVWPKDRARDINGCIRDCEIVWDALFSSFTFAGSIKVTQASLSMDYFCRYHLPFDIHYNSNVEHFRNSFYGGRTEAFAIRKCHASVIDVNSMYPYMLKTTVFPNPRNLKHETAGTNAKGIDLRYFTRLLERFEGCCKCDVYHRPSKVGFLPYKNEEKLLFPNGRFTGTWNFNELRYATDSGYVTIERVHSVTYGERMSSPFVSFVDTLNDQKIAGELSGNWFERDKAKRYSNSLYGKFAQRIDQNEKYIPNIDECFEEIHEHQRKGTFVKLIPLKGDNEFILVTKTDKPTYLPHAIPSFASYCTSAARILLLDKILKMYDKNRVVYCDTDSIFFDIVTPDIKVGKSLGEWQIEKKIVTEIKGLKNYRYIDLKADEQKEIWRCKGVPVIKGRRVKLYRDDGVEEHDAVKQTGPDTFEYWNLVKSKEALKRGITPGKLIKRTKVISGEYDKRKVLTDGETEPIEI